jgi:hypothetical protein
MATNTTPTPAAKVATPWGPATLVEQATMQQRVGEKRFACVLELLEGARGEQLVRIAYSTGGAVRRGPVTFRAADLARLHGALAKTPALAELLGWGGDA